MIKNPVTKVIYSFYLKHRKIILPIFFALVFLIIFAISVVGGLRVFIPYLNRITGFPLEQKNYLVVFQDNNELRPAGGFISAFAKVRFNLGFLTEIDIEDVFGNIDEHEYIEPPYPMKQLLADRWYQGYTFRDGNFTADFPLSAKELIRLYKITNPDASVDGVVAINYSFIQDLMEVLGAVNVDGQSLNSENFFESLETRQSTLKPLADTLINKAFFSPFKWRKIADTITSNLARKEIQLYFTDETLQKLNEKEGWAGIWPRDYSGDFLGVVEANLGGMKSDRYIQRNILYRVRFDEAALAGEDLPTANLEFDIYHHGIENPPLSGVYTGYFRFFKKPSEQSPVDEIIKLSPGEHKVVNKNFILPKEVLQNGTYSLYIPKQSGTPDDFYSIVIEAPRGYSIKSDDFEVKENMAFYKGKLTKDIRLSLRILSTPL